MLNRLLKWVDTAREVNVPIRDDIRNLTITCIVFFLTYLTFTPSLTLMSVSIFPYSTLNQACETCTIDIMVIYYSRVIQYAASFPMCFFFPEIYKFLGLKLVYLLSAGLYIPFYLTMIWIKNDATLYIGALFTAIANSMLWCAAPMCMADSAGPGKYQMYMGFCMFSLFTGVTASGIANYFYLDGVYFISDKIRINLYTAFAVGALLAAVIGAFGIKDVKAKKVLGISTKKDIAALEGLASEDSEIPNAVIEDLPQRENPMEQRISERIYYQLYWYVETVQRKEFWLIVVPLFYWGVLWGYKSTIMSTAIGFTFPESKYIPLKSICIGASYLLGALLWTPMSRCTSNFASLSLCTLMLIVGCVLSVLIFPKTAAVSIDPNAMTYLEPKGFYIIIISCLIGAADSGFCLVFYSAVAKVFASNTTMGYAAVQNWFNVFTIVALFAPKYIDLHVYLYVTLAVVVASWLSLGIGLRHYIKLAPESGSP